MNTEEKIVEALRLLSEALEEIRKKDAGQASLQQESGVPDPPTNPPGSGN